MVSRHERFAAAVDETRAFTAQRFGDEKSRRAAPAERRRMKLDELEIRDARAGVIGERDAVAGGDRRIRGFAKHAAGAAGGEQRRPRVDLATDILGIEIRHADHTSVVDEHFGDERVIDDRDVRERADAVPQRASDFAAGCIACVQHAANGVRGLTPERGPAARIEIESRAPVDELAHVARTFLDEDAHRRFVAQAVAGARRVGCVQRRRVVVSNRGGNAALRVSGVALGRIGLGENEHASGGSEANRGAQPRNSAADDDEVVSQTEVLSYHPHPTRSGLSMETLRLTRIDVPTPSRAYTVTIGDSAIDAIGRLLDDLRLPARRFVVSSPLVWRLHGTQLARAAGVSEPILIPDGERFKQLPTVARVYDALVRANADRATTLITFGGGVIGDMAGFAAATYLRGIPLVHVPTTLLAQVDSAIGGKVGVNHPLGKNLIGAFYQPHAVVVDPTVLGTLPRREFRAGLYEVIKYGMTSSRSLFDRIGKDRKAIFAREPDALAPVIAESCEIKAKVVAADERESGPRRVLNFGHTAGHAIEAITKYRRFRHGEAVAYGMLVAADLAKARGALADRDRQALADLIASLGPLPPISDLSAAQMLEAMQHDKKVVAGRLHFVLPTTIGATTIVDDVTENELRDALKRCGFAK
jgi:3-dehydroquinate synthase